MSTAAKTPNYNLSQVVGSDIPDWITDYTSDMGKIDAALKENADDVDVVRPDEFSEESTYVAGDYCIKNNVIYKAKTAVAAGAFDVSDWEATSIFKELSALTNNFGGVALSIVNVGNNSTTFVLKRPSDTTRYTAFLCSADQNTGVVGIYIIGINANSESINKISGVDANMTRDGDSVTVTFNAVSIWSNALLIAPVVLM